MKETINHIVTDLAVQAGYELVDLIIASDTIRVFVDTPGGITMDDCTRLTRALYDALDESDPGILERYRLEVSSPGIDRPLRTARDFARNVGKQVSVIYAADGAPVSVEGVIEAATDTELLLAGKKGVMRIALDSIRKSRLILEW
ncbi:ribosome maturation factor RimP [bacterium]|nr:ribosome maturation factor RimP [bacterium]